MTVEQFKKEHPRIYERFLECCEEQCEKIDESLSYYGFINTISWSNTKEGHRFWNLIEDKKFDHFYEMYPEKEKLYVHCATQEEWDFASKILGRTSEISYKSMGDCITLYNPNCSLYIKDKSETYSFEEWCKKFNHTFKQWEPKVGEYFYCHTDLIMDHSGIIQATKGKIYPIEKKGCFTNNSGNKDHIVEDYSKWFRKATVSEIADLKSSTSSKIEKWSPGTFVLMLEDNCSGNGYDKGEIVTIKRFDRIDYITYPNGRNNFTKRENEGGIKWFATEKEAKEYWVSINNSKDVKFVKEELLKEAIRRYPMGTKIIDFANANREVEVKLKPYFYSGSNIAGASSGCVLYRDGRWAEIVNSSFKQSTESLLEHAKRLFPIGTVFNNSDIIDLERDNQEVSGGWDIEGNDVVVRTTTGGRFTIYREGKGFANIIKKALDEDVSLITHWHPSTVSLVSDIKQMSVADIAHTYGYILPSLSKETEKQQTKIKSQLQMIPVRKIKVRNNQNN